MEKKIKTLVLDDDRQISLILSDLIEKKIPELELVGIGNTVEQSIELIEKTKPDLVFLDIDFPDGDGFSIIDGCRYHNYEVIFITSHEEFAMKAFEYSALHYLKKPIIPKEVFEAVERFQANITDDEVSVKLKNIKNSLIQDEPKMIIPSTEGLHIIKINDIIRCEASDVYTYFYLTNGKKLIASKSLNNYEKLLSDICFVRIHSKHLINLRYLVQYVKGKGGYVIMEQGDEVEVSIRKKMDFMNKLKDYARSLT
ncbi:MAG: response regulator [Bacteroidales bacterium]|nr:response regulator [Bacteroidales bacterium]